MRGKLGQKKVSLPYWMISNFVRKYSSRWYAWSNEKIARLKAWEVSLEKNSQLTGELWEVNNQLALENER